MQLFLLVVMAEPELHLLLLALLLRMLEAVAAVQIAHQQARGLEVAVVAGQGLKLQLIQLPEQLTQEAGVVVVATVLQAK
jgi:hypothetical protein